MRLLTFILISLCVFAAASAEAKDDNVPSVTSLPVDNPKKKLTILEGWENMEKRLKNATRSLVKMALPQILGISKSGNISSICKRQMMLLISGVNDIKSWAMRFLDSSGKMIDGIITGSTSSLGSYDECVGTVVKSTKPKDESKVLFTGQYCNVALTTSLPSTPRKKYYKVNYVADELKNFSKGDTVIADAATFARPSRFEGFRLGICVPSGCSMVDVDQIAKMGVSKLGLGASVSRCEVKQENEYTPTIIAFMTCYSFAGFLMLVGTLIDLYSYYRKVSYRNKAIRILTAFSLFSNFQKFINTETSSDTLSCLNGIRFLSMSWIIVGHTYLLTFPPLYLGLRRVKEAVVDFAFQAVFNAPSAVDTFFFIGGMLVCYVTIKSVRLQGHQFSVTIYIIHRLWRLLPAYSFLIMFMFFGKLLGSGPMLHELNYLEYQSCHDNWWSNLLFINNFYDTTHRCLTHSWYIAADFQLYLGALIILLPMLRWPRLGILLSLIGILASVVYSGVITYINDYPPTILMFIDEEFLEEYMNHYYFQPFPHAAPYCIGILTGYLLAVKPSIKIPPVIQVLGWSLAFSSNFWVVYGTVGWNRGTDPSLWGGLFYAAFKHVAWTLGVAWMVVCCSTGHGGVINYILSWKAFIPLGRLTFLAYLIHPVVQMSFIGNMRTQIQAQHIMKVWFFFGHLCVTYGLAFAGSMLIEAPFITLEKILLLGDVHKKDDTTLVMENNIRNETLETEKNGDITDIKWNKVDEDLELDQQKNCNVSPFSTKTEI